MRPYTETSLSREGEEEEEEDPQGHFPKRSVISWDIQQLPCLHRGIAGGVFFAPRCISLLQD